MVLMQWDVNGDGWMSRDEMKLMCQQTGQPLSVPELDGAMQSMDHDGNGWVSYANDILPSS